MTIWNRLSIIHAFLPFEARREGLQMAKRWGRAAREDPRLGEDLIRLGGIMTGAPTVLRDGWPTPNLPDPQQRDYQNGRREMALQLLALMNLTPTDLNKLAQEPDYGPDQND